MAPRWKFGASQRGACRGANPLPHWGAARRKKDRTQAKGDIREILDQLAEKHGATARDVTAAMLSIDDTLSDLLYDQERMLQHEM